MSFAKLNKGEIERLRLEDNTINHCFIKRDLNGYSYDEMLEIMVLSLLTDKRHFQQELIKYAENSAL